MVRSNSTSNTINLTDLSAEVLQHGADSHRYPRRNQNKQSNARKAAIVPIVPHEHANDRRRKNKRKASNVSIVPHQVANDVNSHEDDNNMDVEYAHGLTSKHPGFTVRVNKHKQRNISAEETLQTIQSVSEFIGNLCRLPFCYNRDAKYFTSCTCLKGLDNAIVQSTAERVGKSVSLPLFLYTFFYHDVSLIIFFIYI
jgi:hypothetical protein